MTILADSPLQYCFVLNTSVLSIFINMINLKYQAREWVQALADISPSALWSHNNETRAPIANQPHSA